MNEIEKYIVYPIAISVFKQDFETFRTYEVGSLYMDLVESIIKRMQNDFYDLKAELYSKHHIEVKKISKTKYEVNNEIIEFTSEQLKVLTSELMSEYVMGTKEFERQSRPWRDGKYE